MTTPRKLFKDVIESPEFQRDFKKLLKRYRSLEEDFGTFQDTALKAFHKLEQQNVGIVQIPGLGFQDPKVYKATKFACRALKGKGAASGIRVIYAYFPEKDEILFIEIYFKGDQEIEDKERIKRIIQNVKGEK
jgi:mRNA-degrading endonuclease RelE of RelBE toxin-antitoxin system